VSTFRPAPGRGVRLAGAAAAAGVVLYAIQAAFPGACGQALTDLGEEVLYPLLIAAAAGLCIARAIRHRTDRGAWAAMGAGLLLWAAAEVTYTVAYAPMDDPPLPSASDALWLAFFPCAFATIVCLVRERVRRFSRTLWLDGLIGALATAAAGAALVYGPIVAADGGDPATVGVDLSYLLGDVLLVGFAIAAWLLVGRGGRAFALLVGGLALAGAGDAFTLYQGAVDLPISTTLPEVVTPVALLIVAAAAWAPVRVGPVATMGGWRSIAGPAAFGSLALATLVVGQYRTLGVAPVALATAALAIALVRLAASFGENVRLLRATQREALTDALTGLGNRRKLMADLEEAVAVAAPDEPWVLVLFDLDGFKGYNDAFGHPAGDALLARLGDRLARALPPGRSYRLGGDEFCALLPAGDDVAATVTACSTALSDHGPGFTVGASSGRVSLPDETADLTEAVQIADRRLYAQKGERQRHSVSQQTGGVLLQALLEREPELRGHVDRVAELAVAVARRLGLPHDELDAIGRAASLHDVGKVAVPDAILHKPGPLDDAEWSFMRQHTIVGERILRAAPALGHVAGLVRASHERFDGSGYPDGLSGHEIPLGARIVAVCDAFHAMTSERAYSRALPASAAMAELRRCGGTQFDPMVVESFAATLADPSWELALSAPGAWGAQPAGAQARARA
jgi:two-component system, cell cycle response regulator